MSKANIRASLLVAASLLILAGLLFRPTSGWSATEGIGVKPEVSPAAASLLNLLNNGSETKLSGTPGMTADVLKKLMAHRAAGGKLKDLVEFTKVTGVTTANLEVLLKPYQQEEAVRDLDAARKAVPDPSTGAKAGRLKRNEAGTPSGDPGSGAPSNAGPIGAVRPGYYSKLPGYEDLDKIDPLKRTEFLETVNREMCSCGCKGETVAFCLVNDPGCPVVKARAKKIYDDIMTKAPR